VRKGEESLKTTEMERIGRKRRERGKGSDRERAGGQPRWLRRRGESRWESTWKPYPQGLESIGPAKDMLGIIQKGLS
jgi:hypothetical protein